MILGKLFSTAVLASLGDLANTCSGLRKIQGHPQAAASRYESRKPVIITDFSILATRRAIKNQFSARRRHGMGRANGPAGRPKKRGGQVLMGQVERRPSAAQAEEISPLKNKSAATPNSAASQSKLS